MNGHLNMKDKQMVFMFECSTVAQADVNKLFFVNILGLCEKWDCLLDTSAGIVLKKRKEKEKWGGGRCRRMERIHNNNNKTLL